MIVRPTDMPPYWRSALLKNQWSSRPAAISYILSAEILRRYLKKGDHFPLSEDQLARYLRTSRGSVRQAWANLQTQGVVEVDQGRGVKIVNPEQLAFDETSQNMLYQIRAKAEAFLVYRAALNARHDSLSDDDVEAMKEEVAQQEELVTKLEQLQQRGRTDPSTDSEVNSTLLSYFLSDIRFHTAARLSAYDDSVAVIDDIVEWRTYLTRLQSYLDRGFDYIPLSTQQHRRIFEAIVAGQPEEAVRALTEHLETAMDATHDTDEKVQDRGRSDFRGYE